MAAAWAASLALLFPSCVIAGRPDPTPLPPAAGLVKVAMAEYRFDVDAPARRGRVVFQVDNVGTVDHALTLIQIPEDYPPLDEQLRGEERRGAATVARVPARPPGKGSRFAADLGPGRYGFVCFVADADGVIHALKGMSAEFRVV